MSLDRVREIAEGVREVFEKVARDENWNADLGGLCARAAAQIQLACERAGIFIDLWKNYHHAFCEFDGWIVDVTATQFEEGNPAVMIVKAGGPGERYYHAMEDRVGSAVMLLHHFSGKSDLPKDTRAVKRHLGF